MSKMAIIQFITYFLAALTICLAGTSSSLEEIEARERQLAEANNKLALSLFHELESQSSENIFFSPLSLSTAFGMLYYGTKGQTAEELRKFLGYGVAGLPEKLVHSNFQYYLTQTLPTQDPNAYALSYANAALLDRSLDVYSSYKKGIQNYYKASVKELDFKTTNSDVVQDVNKWVKDQTNGKIDQLLDTLDPSEVFVLLNAIYFKGTWKTKFEASDTRPLMFYNNGLTSDARKVPMMTVEEEFPYMTNDELKSDVLEIPYKGENISMIVLLPYEQNGLVNLTENLSSTTLKNIPSRLQKYKVVLTLPKFKVEYSKEMSNDFMALGVKSIFSPGADFSGLTKNKYVYVSQILHKTVLEVNEEGSEASAATGIVSGRMRPVEMIVDHPFLFAIVDKRNDMILFLGRVNSL